MYVRTYTYLEPYTCHDITCNIKHPPLLGTYVRIFSYRPSTSTTPVESSSLLSPQMLFSILPHSLLLRYPPTYVSFSIRTYSHLLFSPIISFPFEVPVIPSSPTNLLFSNTCTYVRTYVPLPSLPRPSARPSRLVSPPCFYPSFLPLCLPSPSLHRQMAVKGP